MTVEIVRLSAQEIDIVQEQIVHIYELAFAQPPYHRIEEDVKKFAVSLARHAQRPGFRCSLALEDTNGQVLGFTYGYTGAAGQWWHDRVSKALGPQKAETWLTGNFELVELAVLPSEQGRGIGGRLHDTLLTALPHRTAALSTYQLETTALHLYRKRGWITLLDGFVFPGSGEPFIIMGLDLTKHAPQYP
ncbi:MAG: GNAT family N-acetyltransferase [Ktedonobacteraceae bacterium]